MPIGGGEIHLVAMHSRKYEGQIPCFWGFNVASGLYSSCVTMLNLRCLAIVFDLDETLIVANTLRSFEDKIESLQRKISSESDPQRVTAMIAEVKRYQDDKNVLKQYAESDQVMDSGKVIKSQSEVVAALSDNHQPTVRPIIRLLDRNVILTRINPLIRDTSVLVRLRPAWENLRNYLTAKGRKRFEVFVCTMAERDYALEMWRLLDPESNLINSTEILDRIVCVKSGSRKSLYNVFQDGSFHPNMALVIDDRLKVWDEKDQPRVHIVPAFGPYYAPQAEANNTVPVLCVARNVACRIRGGFFKEFDEVISQQISEVAYEDDMKKLMFPPDVSNFLISEKDPSASNGNKDLLGFDGMADVEVERRLKETISVSSSKPLLKNSDPRMPSSLQNAMSSIPFSIPPTMQGPAMPYANHQASQMTTLLKPPLAPLGPEETNFHLSPVAEEGEVPESELDPDTRRRLLILQHGQDMRSQAPSESPFPSRPSVQTSVPRIPPRGWHPAEEQMSPEQLNRVASTKECPSNEESLPIDPRCAHHPSFPCKTEPPFPPRRILLGKQRFPKEALPKENLRLNQALSGLRSFSDEDGPWRPQPSVTIKDPDLEAGQSDPYPNTSTGALYDIAYKCGAKVEFNQALLPISELKFSAEVLFAGQKIGEGIGRTRREAQRQASKVSLLNLADKYLSNLESDSDAMLGNEDRFTNPNGNGLVDDPNSFGYRSLREEFVPLSMTTPQRILDPRIEISKKRIGSIACLNELVNAMNLNESFITRVTMTCMRECLDVEFQTQPQFSGNSVQKNEVYAQVEINGQLLGKGIGRTMDEAKSQAAEKTLGALSSMLSKIPHRNQGSSVSLKGISNKRLKPNFSRVSKRIRSAKFPKNASPVP